MSFYDSRGSVGELFRRPDFGQNLNGFSDAIGSIPAFLDEGDEVVVPTPPRNLVALPGNTSASVTFQTPLSAGDSPITGYTVTSSPPGGTDANAGSLSLTHTITGLTNGQAYTFTATATSAVGTSEASAPSNSVTPTAGTAVLISGPSQGNFSQESGEFVVSVNGGILGTLLITPSSSGAGTLTPASFNLSAANPTGVFTYRPTSIGTFNINAANDGSLTDPANIAYTVRMVGSSQRSKGPVLEKR